MKVDAGSYSETVLQAAQSAAEAEASGFDAAWVSETQIDPFIGATLAAERTGEIQIGTGIAIAFARNPMSVAVQANDLQTLSEGRFHLGLGSQIKPHITRRYSMEWSRPAARMREFISAVWAIWKAWETGEKLDFRGDFYTHTLMTPFFDPGPNPFGNPRIMLAAVGPLMTEVAGEVADGMFCHSFSTERYVHEVTLPALRRGRDKAGKSMTGFEVTAPAMVVSGDTEEEIEASKQAAREQIAFYGSTPAYRGVLELHGWGELHDELLEATKKGRWSQLGEMIDDEILATFAVIGSPEEAAVQLKRRYGDVCTRVMLTLPPNGDGARWVRGFASVSDRG